MLYKSLVKKVSIPSEKKIKKKDYLESGILPIIDQGSVFIGGYSNDMSKVIQCNLPVIVFGDHTKAVKYLGVQFGAGADGVKILEPKDFVFAKYLYYGTQYLALRIVDKGYARHYQHIEKEDLPLPSFEEQQRIVSKIEELFSQLDSGVATLKKTKEQIAVYRQTVLKEAFSHISETINMDSVACMIDPHPSHRTPPEVQNGIPYIGIGDIDYKNRIINYQSARKVSPDILKEHIERYKINKDDFVMGKIGTIGKPFILELPQNYALSANVILIQPNSTLIRPQFLFWQFSSPLITAQLIKGATATSQPAFGIKKARLLKIKICDLLEQDRILEHINEKMSVCDNIEKTIDAALQEAEAMRQSILKQAFKGELI